ncbi:hypothetical protein KZ467_07805 [Glaesserella parasuis]|nr:hypothetical protein [Glaesserella parasuis]
MKTKLPNIESNTGRFIDGNPATGTLGTIVTAKWLNEVQERIQDYFEEFKNVLLLANMQPKIIKLQTLLSFILETLMPAKPKKA